jgi:hypothetical protein
MLLQCFIEVNARKGSKQLQDKHPYTLRNKQADLEESNVVENYSS